jgi:hypothetical protein
MIGDWPPEATEVIRTCPLSCAGFSAIARLSRGAASSDLAEEGRSCLDHAGRITAVSPHVADPGRPDNLGGRRRGGGCAGIGLSPGRYQLFVAGS